MQKIDRTKLLNRLLLLFDEAEKIGYLPEVVDAKNYIFALTRGKHRITFYDFPDFNPPGTNNLVRNKKQTTRILEQHGIPTAQGTSHRSLFTALNRSKQLGFPLVVKPTYGTLSQGAYFPIKSWSYFIYSFCASKRYGLHTMVERYIHGSNYRILIIDGNVAAAVLRMPAHVVGDGDRTITELIHKKNKDPRRKPIHIQNSTLHHLVVDNRTHRFLQQQHLTLESIPTQGTMCLLDNKVLLSRGGDMFDVTEHMHEDNKTLGESAAQALNAPVAGIDWLLPDISQSYKTQDSAIIDINGKPYIDLHHYPTKGTTRNVAALLAQLLPTIHIQQ